MRSKTSRRLPMTRPGRLRRARTILAYWRKGQLVFENYRTGTTIVADPVTVVMLYCFERWRSPSAMARGMPGYTQSSLERAIGRLERHKFLLREGSSQVREDAAFEKKWSWWQPHAAFFHFGTKDIPYMASERAIERAMRAFLAASPQPAFFKRYPNAVRRPLPRAEEKQTAGRPGFPALLLARRTLREFSSQPLPLTQLASLLHYTWGVTGFAKEPPLGYLPLKTSPSGGARHPGEVYVLALRVEGLPPGLYHYSPHRHWLERLRSGNMARQAVRYCAGQTWVGKAAALFLMTAVFPRTMWKYRTSRAYRMVLAEAGHLCQTFYLVATWLGLAPFCTMALRDSLIERDLGLDGIAESILYVAGVGMPRSEGGSFPRVSLG